MLYLVLKSLHIIAVIAWMAGMLYLPRLYVYHADTKPGSPQSEMFKVMERRLLRAIINPAMVATWIFGSDPRLSRRLLAAGLVHSQARAGAGAERRAWRLLALAQGFRGRSQHQAGALLSRLERSADPADDRHRVSGCPAALLKQDVEECKHAIGFVVSDALMLPSAASAQLPVRKYLPIGLATEAVLGAVEKCENMNQFVAAAVVDSSGQALAILRHDRAKMQSLEQARQWAQQGALRVVTAQPTSRRRAAATSRPRPIPIPTRPGARRRTMRAALLEDQRRRAELTQRRMMGLPIEVQGRARGADRRVRLLRAGRTIWPAPRPASIAFARSSDSWRNALSFRA